MKFRETFKSKYIQSIGYPVLIGVGFFVASPYLLRLYSHRIVFYRFYKFIFACNFMTMSWMYLNTKTWSSKPLHDIITQPEPNGKYVRTILKENFPGNWNLISKELHNLGYNFKEMNEYSDKQTMPDVTYKFDDSMY
jgi:hypothetical protein